MANNPYYATPSYSANGYPPSSYASTSAYPAAMTSSSFAGPAYPGQAGPYAGPAAPPYTGYDGPNSHFVTQDSHRAAFDASMAEQSSIYTPEAAKKSGVNGVEGKGKSRTTVLRKGAGGVWEDKTLMEWDPTHFRLFVGDLDPALSDDQFTQAFANPRYASFVKARIVRDKHTNKGKGFGFVSYSDPEDFLKVWKEMNGKYVGTRPVTIKKATTGVQAVTIGDKKARALDAKTKKKTGTVPYEKANLAEAEGVHRAGRQGFGPDRNRQSYIRR